jgi:hypothetical protein
MLLCGLASPAQDADSGLSVPVTISGGAMYSERLQLRDPSNSPAAGAFRTMLYPTLRLGSHWFGYAAVQVRSTPYFYYDAFTPGHVVDTDVLQAFVGYSVKQDAISMVIKAGQLSSAFGSFPLHYDDAENPLLDQPLSYIQRVTLRPDQIPCGTADLLRQSSGSVSFSCGGEPGRGPGLTPVTLYGLQGIQAEVSAGRWDARAQLTSGSPIYPMGIGQIGHYLQWTAGGGYSIRQGFRVGFSGFRGPYLEPEAASFLPAGTTARDFPASGLGTDVQWARGHWSAAGELHRFRFDSPNFAVPPSILSGYLDVKRVLTPRLYLAGRAGFLNPGRVVDKTGVSANEFAKYLRSYELSVGFWLARNQLLKGSYEWLRTEGRSGRRTDVLGFQYVVTLHPIAWAFNR